jgi:hypothetical protein
MRKLTLISAVLIIIFVLSDTGQAGNNLSVSYSPTNIAQAMDFAVKSNTLSYLYAQEPMANDTIYPKANESKPGKLKSPTTALVIALVPGSVVHGAGHFYAGKTKTAFVLFGAEIIGAGMAFLGGAVSSAPHDTGGESGSGGDAVLILGLGLFVGSWMYDVMQSPLVVKNQNDKLLGK